MSQVENFKHSRRIGIDGLDIVDNGDIVEVRLGQEEQQAQRPVRPLTEKNLSLDDRRMRESYQHIRSSIEALKQFISPKVEVKRKQLKLDEVGLEGAYRLTLRLVTELKEMYYKHEEDSRAYRLAQRRRAKDSRLSMKILERSLGLLRKDEKKTAEAFVFPLDKIQGIRDFLSDVMDTLKVIRSQAATTKENIERSTLIPKLNTLLMLLGAILGALLIKGAGPTDAQTGDNGNGAPGEGDRSQTDEITSDSVQRDVNEILESLGTIAKTVEEIITSMAALMIYITEDLNIDMYQDEVVETNSGSGEILLNDTTLEGLPPVYRGTVGRRTFEVSELAGFTSVAPLRDEQGFLVTEVNGRGTEFFNVQFTGSNQETLSAYIVKEEYETFAAANNVTIAEQLSNASAQTGERENAEPIDMGVELANFENLPMLRIETQLATGTNLRTAPFTEAENLIATIGELQNEIENFELFIFADDNGFPLTNGSEGYSWFRVGWKDAEGNVHAAWMAGEIAFGNRERDFTLLETSPFAGAEFAIDLESINTDSFEASRFFINRTLQTLYGENATLEAQVEGFAIPATVTTDTRRALEAMVPMALNSPNPADLQLVQALIYSHETALSRGWIYDNQAESANSSQQTSLNLIVSNNVEGRTTVTVGIAFENRVNGERTQTIGYVASLEGEESTEPHLLVMDTEPGNIPLFTTAQANDIFGIAEQLGISHDDPIFEGIERNSEIQVLTSLVPNTGVNSSSARYVVGASGFMLPNGKYLTLDHVTNSAVPTLNLTVTPEPSFGRTRYAASVAENIVFMAFVNGQEGTVRFSLEERPEPAPTTVDDEELGELEIGRVYQLSELTGLVPADVLTGIETVREGRPVVALTGTLVNNGGEGGFPIMRVGQTEIRLGFSAEGTYFENLSDSIDYQVLSGQDANAQFLSGVNIGDSFLVFVALENPNGPQNGFLQYYNNHDEEGNTYNPSEIIDCVAEGNCPVIGQGNNGIADPYPVLAVEGFVININR